jgi:hypothetical protein
MGSVSYVVALLGPALASATMGVLLWLPFWIGIALVLLALPTVAALPLHLAPTSNLSGEEDEGRPLLPLEAPKDTMDKPSLIRSIGDSYSHLESTITSHPRNFSLLLTSFLLTSLASSDTKLLLQYISKRFYWTFASAGYLLSGKAVVNFTLLTLIIPNFLRSRSLSMHPDGSTKANIRYANICLMISILGAFAIGLASSIWVLIPSLLLYALGSALPVFTLSLLKSPSVSLPPDERLPGSSAPETHIFSIVMLVKTLGSLLGAPLMTVLWVSGIRIGGVALGMPYFVSAACYLIAILVLRSLAIGE